MRGSDEQSTQLECGEQEDWTESAVDKEEQTQPPGLSSRTATAGPTIGGGKGLLPRWADGADWAPEVLSLEHDHTRKTMLGGI